MQYHFVLNVSRDFKEFYLPVQCENLCFASEFYIYTKSDMLKIVVLPVSPGINLSFLDRPLV